MSVYPFTEVTGKNELFNLKRGCAALASNRLKSQLEITNQYFLWASLVTLFDTDTLNFLVSYFTYLRIFVYFTFTLQCFISQALLLC